MRAVEYVRQVRWLYDSTYKVHVERAVPVAEIERFLDQLEADYGLTPTAEQVTGNNLVVGRSLAPIEENAAEGTDDE